MDTDATVTRSAAVADSPQDMKDPTRSVAETTDTRETSILKKWICTTFDLERGRACGNIMLEYQGLTPPFLLKKWCHKCKTMQTLHVTDQI